MPSSTTRMPHPGAALLPTLRRILLILALTLPATATAGPAVRDAEPPRPGEGLRQELLQHRQAEADAKVRLLGVARRAEAAATPNQVLYDVRTYDLDLTLDPVARLLTGQATVRARVTGASISTLDLDLHTKMIVSAVSAGGSPTTWSRVSNVLTVNLGRSYSTGETAEVRIAYSGDPNGDYFGWGSADGKDMIWTLSEPYGAREWWPCKDVTNDKADTVDVRATVPAALKVVSNGLLVSDVANGPTHTVHWRSTYPIVPYLVSLAIHPYTFFDAWYPPLAGGAPMEVQFYVYASHYSLVQATYALTVPMITAFAQGFGEYPFLREKYGHAEFVWGGGMEHQTCTSLGGWSEDLISHELSHQWWGDFITCADFGHIWLNEGFATWCEAYWKEKAAGPATYRAYMNASAYYGPGTVFVDNPTDFARIFDTNLSYNKGSWVVHMLRGVVGDPLFYAGLANYRALYGYGSATTEQFRDAMEAVAGVDLDAFFTQWVYGQFYPVYRYAWSQSGSGLDVTIDQIQTNTGLFTMPIPIRVTTTTGTYDFKVQNALASESYHLAVGGNVQSVLLDPDDWILKKVETPMPNASFRRGILVVNGVDWGYGSEITTAYRDSAFWGAYPISFWDTFSEPAGGYPANLPRPLGHGAVPPDTLGQFTSVVWAGNYYQGDLTAWNDTPIQSYLEAGGNVFLMSRYGQSFLRGGLTGYAGVTWSTNNTSLGTCTSVYPGLVNIPFTNSQAGIDVFLTAVGPQSTLLFQNTGGGAGTSGIGVHAQPAGGGRYRPDGGRFVYLAARPYRLDHAALRANAEFILHDLFGETLGRVEAPAATVSPVRLRPGVPNPFRAGTTISFTLPAPMAARLSLYDASGRLVRTLLDGTLPAGEHRASWNGTSGAGRKLASGIYYARLVAGGVARTQSLVLAR